MTVRNIYQFYLTGSLVEYLLKSNLELVYKGIISIPIIAYILLWFMKIIHFMKYRKGRGILIDFVILFYVIKKVDILSIAKHSLVFYKMTISNLFPNCSLAFLFSG